MARLQYQRLAEVPPTGKGTGFDSIPPPDRWQPRTETPDRAFSLRRTAAAFACVLATTTFCEVPYADGSSNWLKQETITADKWKPTYPDYFPKKGLDRSINATGVSEVPPSNHDKGNWTEWVSIDKWKPTYIDRYLPLKIYRAENQTALVEVPYADGSSNWNVQEVVRVDKWLPKHPDYFPRPILSRAINATGVSEVPPSNPDKKNWTEWITIDKWQPDYPDYIFRQKTLPAAIHPSEYGKSSWVFTVYPPQQLLVGITTAKPNIAVTMAMPSISIQKTIPPTIAISMAMPSIAIARIYPMITIVPLGVTRLGGAIVDSVNEKTSLFLTCTFTDQTGAAVVPTTANYSLYQEITYTTIVNNASLTPASSITVEITPAQNTMTNAGVPAELRKFTVTAMYSSGTREITQNYYYQLVKTL